MGVGTLSRNISWFYRDRESRRWNDNGDERPRSALEIGICYRAVYQVHVTQERFFREPGIFATVDAESLQVPPLTGDSRYYWRARGKNAHGLGPWTEASFRTGTPVSVEQDLPPAPALKVTVFPNPASTLVHFELASSGEDPVVFSIYDVAGRLTYSKRYETIRPGRKTIRWLSAEYSSGTYIFEVRKGEERASGTFIIRH